MDYLKSNTYCRDIEAAIRHTVGMENFYGKKVLILGAAGLIGSFLTDCLIQVNETRGGEIAIYAVSRKAESLRQRFGENRGKHLHFIEADVMKLDVKETFDYIIHGAGYGHPEAFRKIPVEVLLSNVVGMEKVLQITRRNPACRVIYISSGEAQEQTDHLSSRACYPMGKKAAETLCISYMEEYGADVVIARPCHTFGANVAAGDNRAAAQFLASAFKGKNIDMYSMGEQERSFAYVADCVSGLLTVLSEGSRGKVYGISTGESCTLREFAGKCASAGGCRITMHIPNHEEKKETSPIARQIVDNRELQNLGWHFGFSIEEGIRNSIQIMREMDRN